ncbi:hypothetical protein L9F63_009119, partial [Diploptera punctata]
VSSIKPDTLRLAEGYVDGDHKAFLRDMCFGIMQSVNPDAFSDVDKALNSK